MRDSVRKQFRICLFLAIAEILLCHSSFGQTVYTTALSTNPLENLGHSPRASAMGNAFTAMDGDAACLFYNPAGLNNLSETQLSLVHQSWIAGMSQETMLAGVPTGSFGAFAAGVNYLSYGILDGYDATGTSTSPLIPFRGSLSLGWGGPMTRSLSLGLAARGLIQSLTASNSSFSSSVQAGALWTFPPNLRLGVTYDFLNNNNSSKFGVLTLGISGSVPIFFKIPTLLLANYTLPLYSVSEIQFGAEQHFLNILCARLGYQWEIDDNQITGFRGFTAGLGFEMGDFSLDYSYVPDGDLGDSQMVGLSYRFPGEKPALHATSLTPLPPASTPTPSSQLNFNPPAQVSPADKVVRVETRFQIPDTDSAPASEAYTPELRKNLAAAGIKVEQNPKDFQAWMDLGNLYWRLGQADYTVQCFQEALHLQPENGALKAWLDHYLKLHPGRE